VAYLPVLRKFQLAVSVLCSTELWQVLHRDVSKHLSTHLDLDLFLLTHDNDIHRIGEMFILVLQLSPQPQYACRQAPTIGK
jgi:hypothetical protein